MGAASESTVTRSCTSGAIAFNRASCCSLGDSGRTPAVTRYGVTRETNSAAGNARTWVPLIASAFLRSKRAGLALTLVTSKAAIISSTLKTSRSSAIDQPSRAR